MEKNPALEVAKEQKQEQSVDRILSTGVRARFVPVAASLIQSVVTKIKDPEVPMWLDDTKNREIPNPDDPAYQKALIDANAARGTAAMDALILFGIELSDGMPEDDMWLKKILFLERQGMLDLSKYDLEDPLDREFIYKKFIVVGSDDLVVLGQISRLSREDIDAAASRFPSNAG